MLGVFGVFLQLLRFVHFHGVSLLLTQRATVAKGKANA
jgi:hypothetical protein